MREIKFRWWSLKDKLMLNDPLIKIKDAMSLNDCIISAQKEAYILLQYTGLKDINGIDIYEGDLVKYESLITASDNPYIAIIFWDVEASCWAIIASDNRLYLLLDFDLEVIGNIYENPELMEK